GVEEVDFQIEPEILAPLCPAPPLPPATAAKNIAEPKEVAQNVAEIREGLRIKALTAGILQSGMAKTIVCRPLLRIAEHARRLGGFLELVLGGRVVGMVVGMELARKLAVSPLDVGLTGFPAYTQNFVVISF